MKTFLKITGMLFVFTLAVLPMAGCDNPPWEAGMTLVLKLDAPKDGITVNTPVVTVSGRVNGSEAAGAMIKVNEATATVKDGQFSAEVPLTEGKNVITVVATTGQVKMNEQRTITYAPAK